MRNNKEQQNDVVVEDQHQSRGPLSLELEAGQHHTDNQNQQSTTTARQGKNTTSSPAWAKARYIMLATLAMVLALTCPGTHLYHRSSPRTTGAAGASSSSSFSWLLFLQAVMGYVSTLALLCMLNGSDPGYLSDLEDSVWEDLEEDETLLVLDDQENENAQQQQHQPGVLVESPGDPIPISSSDWATDDNGNISKQMNQRRSSFQDTTNDDANANDIDVPFQGTRRRYCPTCRVSPPLRSHHCKHCDQCVATFDHHCDFVGTCIGERNHARFWWFLLAQALGFSILCHIVGSAPLGFTTFLLPSSSSAAAAAAGHPVGAADPSLWDAARVIVAKCYLYPLRFFAWIMVILHTWMAVSSSTTFESSKGPRHIEYLKGTKCADLPFSKGLFGNLCLFCCKKDDTCTGVASTRPCGNLTKARQGTVWRPTIWQPPGKIDRESEDLWDNPWQNKYWSCC